MNTGLAVLIVVIVVVIVAVIVALAVRARKQRQHATQMRLPELGALSTDGLDKEHAATPQEQPNDPEHRHTPGS